MECKKNQKKTTGIWLNLTMLANPSRLQLWQSNWRKRITLYYFLSQSEVLLLSISAQQLLVLDCGDFFLSKHRSHIFPHHITVRHLHFSLPHNTIGIIVSLIFLSELSSAKTTDLNLNHYYYLICWRFHTFAIAVSVPIAQDLAKLQRNVL